MEQELDLSTLNGQNLDPELFRRVWDRVMPNQENSPLVLDAPKADFPDEPAIPASLPAEPASPPACLSDSSQADLPVLQQLIDQAQATLTALLPLLRAGGLVARTASGIAADYRRALRQLSAARFLIVGQRYHPAPATTTAFPSIPLALRDQFIRAKHWQWICGQAGQATNDMCLRELYEELARTGSLHAGLIRSLLEQM